MNADIHTLTGAYALHALSEAERVEFEDHLAQCPACAKEVAEMQETAARLGSAVATQPPESLKQDVMAGIRRVRQLPPDEGPIIPLRGRKWPLRVTSMAAAAAAIAAIVLGSQVIRLDDEASRAEEQLAEVSSRYETVADMIAAQNTKIMAAKSGDMRATVVVSRQHGKVAFLPKDVPAPGEEKTYQLWLIGPDGAHSAGLLPDQDTPVIADTIEGANVLGVTIEPEGGSEQPTTDPVMTMALG
ncbi:anti-sigma factor [Haloechinothrix halophila]|uniref:anti-sigma factor n=1 Tax=Haloechinothrix halophila TaxID=1069073 RepID=UPI00041D642F|nr:anti-sigma factor [Haloechinothrix halophila]